MRASNALFVVLMSKRKNGSIKMKKGEFSKLVVALIIALNVIFSFSVLFAFVKTATEPSTLIACWFGFTTGELWILAGIKKKKINGNEKE